LKAVCLRFSLVSLSLRRLSRPRVTAAAAIKTKVLARWSQSVGRNWLGWRQLPCCRAGLHPTNEKKS